MFQKSCIPNIVNKILILFLILFDCEFTTTIKFVSGQEEVFRLGAVNIDHEKISLSGFSSGGTFAQQLQISYSSLFSGIGVISHAYYRCGPGDGLQDNYDNACTRVGTLGPTSPQWNPDLAVADILSYRDQGLIDDPINLFNKPLYVYSGTRSSFFHLATSLGILNVYEPFIQNANAVRTRVQSAEVVLPSNNFGGSCAQDASNNSFIANCGFSGAFESLNFILGGGLVQPDPNLRADRSKLLTFDQTEFFFGVEGTGRHDMDTQGYIYVPKKCFAKKCLLHLYFHGCLVGREFVGAEHIVNSGYLEVAALNDIVMVFPQALSSLPQNQIGCWDTYGLTGPLYATQRGAQVTVVRNILARLLGENTESSSQINLFPAVVYETFENGLALAK